MMARKNNSKADTRGSIVFDTRTKAVMAQSQQDDVRGKIQSVREIVPGKSNNEIHLVLQYYDNNVERTIQAYLEDGAKEALKQWHYSGNKTANKKKKKNKPKSANQQSQGKPADQSEKPNDETTDVVENSIAEPKHLVNGSGDAQSTINGESLEGGATDSSSSSPLSSSGAAKPLPPPQQALPQRSRNQQPHSGHPGPHGHPAHPTHHARERTISEQSASSVSSASQISKKPHAGLEKSIKDLQRQTLSIDRYKRVLNEEVDRSSKRIKTVFEEMFKALRDRESLLQAEMDIVKRQALETFSMRQAQAINLKTKVDRAAVFSETELAELRTDIKHFVTDRKIDEDLGKTTRFMYDSDHLQGEIKKFGEVVPVRCAYSKRRPSASSLVSQTSESGVDMETSPTPASRGGASSSLAASSSMSAVSSTPTTTASSSRQGEIIDVKTTQELAEIQRKLKDSLRLQGVPVKSPPSRQGRPSILSGAQRSGSGGQRTVSDQRSGSRDNERSRPAGQRSGPSHTSTGNAQAPSQGTDEVKRSRNAKRRQKQRERQREANTIPEGNANALTPPKSKQSPGKVPRSGGQISSSAQNAELCTTDRSSPGEGAAPSHDASHDSNHDNQRNEKSLQGSVEIPNSPKRTSENDISGSKSSAVAKATVSVSRNSATISVNGTHSGDGKAPKRAEVIVNGDIHK